MRAIIDGKRYNTDTATAIAAFSHGGGGDFTRVDESLYRTPRGNYFLAGSGGPMSDYAQSCGQNSWCGGSAIRPISPREARGWLEQHDEYDAIETYFADSTEDA